MVFAAASNIQQVPQPPASQLRRIAARACHGRFVRCIFPGSVAPSPSVSRFLFFAKLLQHETGTAGREKALLRLYSTVDDHDEFLPSDAGNTRMKQATCTKTTSLARADVSSIGVSPVCVPCSCSKLAFALEATRRGTHRRRDWLGSEFLRSLPNQHLLYSWN